MTTLPGDSQVTDRLESTLHAVDSATRKLSDGVMQTSEDAVIAEGMAPPQGHDAAAAASRTGRRLPTVAEGNEAVRRYVADNPCKSALIAAGAGALAMLLVGSQARKYRQAIDWSRRHVPYHPFDTLRSLTGKRR